MIPSFTAEAGLGRGVSGDRSRGTTRDTSALVLQSNRYGDFGGAGRGGPLEAVAEVCTCPCCQSIYCGPFGLWQCLQCC